MTRSHLKGTVSWLLPLILSGGVYACGSSSEADSGDSGSGSGSGSRSGSGSGSGSGGTTGTGAGFTPGPQYPGTGDGFRPLVPGCGPSTAAECTGSCEQRGGDGGTVIRPPATLCFAGEGDPTPDDPSAVIEQVIEEVDGVAYIHIRITFDPAFTDNTYGEGTSSGWPAKGGPKMMPGMDMPGMDMPETETKPGHTFGDLTGSDHTELQLTDGSGETIMNFKVDLISERGESPCGYGSLGVLGGDGKMILGDPDDVLAVSTSIDRNLNGCGYCDSTACASSGDCTVDSPSTDDNFTPNSATPSWDYRQVYEVWIALDAFGDEGFGQAYITYTHSSPAKLGNTIEVEPTPCPPEWDQPYCPPGVIEEGGNCYGDDGVCPPNQQTYVTSEGASLCTPIPYANYDDMKPCPDGYVLDIASEGQFCIPSP